MRAAAVPCLSASLSVFAYKAVASCHSLNVLPCSLNLMSLLCFPIFVSLHRSILLIVVLFPNSFTSYSSSPFAIPPPSYTFLFSSLTSPRHLHPYTQPLTARIFTTHLSLRSSLLVILPFPYLSFARLSFSIPTPHCSSSPLPSPSPLTAPHCAPLPSFPPYHPLPAFSLIAAVLGWPYTAADVELWKYIFPFLTCFPLFLSGYCNPYIHI